MKKIVVRRDWDGAVMVAPIAEDNLVVDLTQQFTGMVNVYTGQPTY
jgi:hypothetical protein